jgi:flagellar L-ring protein FlgH
MMQRFAIALVLVLSGSSAMATDLYSPGNWASMASDRKASQVGDIVTLLVVENDSASNTVTKSSRKRNSIDVGIETSLNFAESASGTLGGSYNGEGTNGRSDRMVARLSVTVAEVYPNGDMRVTGMQRLKINGETTAISLSGRVRPDDLTADNTLLSWRLADAVIDYDGKGFASRSAKPGLVTKVLSFLGLL